MKIIRVFPRRTKATPLSGLTRIPDMFDEADEVHVSVAFTYDLPRAEWLAKQWAHVAPVKIGGPATGDKGNEFEPGMYLKNGYVITSRGCPNNCWFCAERGTGIRELKINDGNNVLDSNLLACTDDHIKAVFAMLKRQKQRAEFTGGIEAARLKKWHVDLFADLKPKQIFFAYDTPDDLDPLIEAGKLLRGSNFKIKHPLRAYVLCGYKKDTFEAAEKRLAQTVDAGFLPMAMVWTPKTGKADKTWKKWQRNWSRPALMSRLFNKVTS